MIDRLYVSGYRSLVNFTIDLAPVTVVSGANGTGKSNLYHSLKMLHHAATGTFAQAVAKDGGMNSLLWSGKTPGHNRKRRFELKISVFMEPLSFELVAGLPPQGPEDPTLFRRDPDLKEEFVWAGNIRRPSNTVAERKGRLASIAGDSNRLKRTE